MTSTLPFGMQDGTSKNGGRRRFTSKDRPKRPWHRLSCYFFLGNLEEKECTNLSGHVHDIKLHHHKIKEEVALWSLAGAKAVSDVMPQE
jgi:hypothetical protein